MFISKKNFIVNISLVILGIIFTISLPVLSSEKITFSPQELAVKGQQFYQQGNLNKAIENWRKAAIFYQQEGNLEKKTANLLNTATAEQGLGLKDKSCETVFEAFAENVNCFEVLNKIDRSQNNDILSVSEIKTILDNSSSLNKSVALLRLGDYLSKSDYPQQGKQLALESLKLAKEIEDRNKQSSALLSLGNISSIIIQKKQNRFPPQTIAEDIVANFNSSSEFALKPYQEAIDYYQQAAKISNNSLNIIKANLNQLKLLINTQKFWEKATSELQKNITKSSIIKDADYIDEIKQGAIELKLEIDKTLQPQIINLISQIKPQLENIPLSNSAVIAQINFGESLIRQGEINLETANILAKAISKADLIQNPATKAQATGYLGHLYEKQQQYDEARRLTEKALELAPTIQYPEIAYVWHAQLGRIYKSQNNREPALSAYEASFNTIKALRSDLATIPVEPIFREYISLLLQEETSPKELDRARNVLESLQIVELDNFFSDPCSPVSDTPVIIDEVDKEAAVIYPIMLSDRLEVILTVPGQPLQRYSTPISPEEVKEKIDRLRTNSFTNPGFASRFERARGNSEQQQIISSSIQISLEKNILPLAEEIYDWLVRPAERALVENNIKTLVFVLDGSLRSIPMSLLYDGEKYLIQQDYNVALSSGLQLTNPQPLKRQPIRILAAGTTADFPNFDPIPEVETELNNIKAIFDKSKILFNEDFTEASLRKELEESKYPIVHLATHGQFSSNSDETFIISGSKGEIINVKQLDDLLRVGKFRNSTPIELLVLSACETAKGDSEAILGLAGVAVRAGARSTIATLWAANDNATADLMGKFYQNLADNNQISKAKALREAQISLLETPNYSHPYYWAPFVLVGNWL